MWGVNRVDIGITLFIFVCSGGYGHDTHGVTLNFPTRIKIQTRYGY